MAGLAYRGHFFFSLLGNLIFITITYFLWKSIFKNADMIKGMTFEQAFAYLSFAAAISTSMTTWSDWEMSRKVLEGSLVVDLIKPLDFQLQTFFSNLGFVLNNVCALTLPTLIFVTTVFKVGFPLGFNLVFFIISYIMAVIIAFVIDYIIGLVSFYTESIWGISTTKDVIIMLLSGMVIPLNFYPEALAKVVLILPFQGICNIPVRILMGNGMELKDYLQALAFQAVWMVVLIIISRVFYAKAVKVITVNGG